MKNGEIMVMVRFSPSGKFLTVSDPSGNIYILPINDKEKLLKELKGSDKKMHK
jgi:hypothetical protein